MYSSIALLIYSLFQAIRQRAKKQRTAKKTSALSSLGSAVSSGTAAVVIENIAQTQRFDGSFQDDKPTNTASGSNEDEDDEK